MRGSIVIVGMAAALAACGQADQTEDAQDLNRALTAQNIVANDVTAIDAVTADAANMAADVDFTDALANELEPAGRNGADSAAPRSRASREPRRPAPRPSAPPAAPADDDEPSSNSSE